MVDPCRLHRLRRPLPLQHLELLGRLDLRLRGDALNFAVILRFVHLFVLRVVALKCAIEREFVHEHISEHVDFFALRLDVRSIALVGDFDHGCGRWRLEDETLELDLLDDYLVCFVGGELELLLDLLEVADGWSAGSWVL